MKLSKNYDLSFRQVNTSITVKDISGSDLSGKPELRVMADVSISGTVTDENGDGLPGASVIVQGTSTGTVTDIEGKYTLSVPEDASVLVSFVGYLDQVISVGGRSVLDVQLQLDSEQLEEVVIIGYGTRTKGEITGAVTSVNDDYITQQPVANVSRALQGSASGVTVVSPATPGTDAEIRIRGMGTINNNNPLWVVDGVYDAKQPPPSQIASVEILKDAASTAIYGARGANGVIIVTTKSGKTNQPLKLEFSVRTGFSSPNQKFDIMTDPVEVGQMLYLEQTNDGIVAPSDQHFQMGATINDVTPNEWLLNNDQPYDQQTNPLTRTNLDGTDWLSETYDNAPITDINVSISGGSENTNYAFHASYLDEGGVVKHTSFDRYAFRTNVDSKVKDWLKVGQRLGLTFEQTNGYSGNNGRGLFRSFFEQSPLIPMYDEGGNYAGGVVGGLNDGPNPVANLDRQSDNYRRNLIMSGNFYAEIEPIKDLKIKTLYGYDVRNIKNFTAVLPAWEDSNGARGTDITNRSQENITWNWSNTINYKKTFGGDHTIDALLGIEARESTVDWFSAGRSGYFSTDLNFLTLRAGSEGILNDGTGWAKTTYSQFGRLLYNFKEKYQLEATVRRDGSSVFAEDKRWGVFPAFSAGWNISSESFMSGTSNWLDFMKIRASWGQSGNDIISADASQVYNAYTTFSSGLGNSFYAIDGSDGNISLGYQSDLVGNPDAIWETTTSFNIAIDASLFNSFDLTVDVWQKNTADMLFRPASPGILGIATYPSQNIGSMENNGIDITLDYHNEALGGDLKYSIAGTFSHYKNEVTALDGLETSFLPGNDVRGQIYTRTEVGRSFPEFHGYEIDGIFQTQAEADAHPTHGTYNQPGNLIFRDVDGSGTIDADDRTYIGSPHPDFTAGLRLSAAYKSFDLSATFYASYGNDIANYTRRFSHYGLFQGPKSSERLYQSWGSPFLDDNANATLPRATTATSQEQLASSVYIEDGSFLRLQNLQLGYNLPSSFLEKLSISTARIYVMGSNLFTLTGFSGLDPEFPTPSLDGSRSEIDRGVYIGAWPVTKQFMFGLNVSF
ncbi:MAG: TonB-dependent receptor [Reichenbachiella sp.]